MVSINGQEKWRNNSYVTFSTLNTDVAYSYEWIGWGLISKIPNSQNKVKPGNEKLHSVSDWIHTKTEINDCTEVQKQKPLHAAMKTENWPDSDQGIQIHKLMLRQVKGEERWEGQQWCPKFQITTENE
jgi:hypothetical protein